jgi:hypothetical protein
VDPVPGPLLCRKFGSAGNRTQDLWVSSQEIIGRKSSGPMSIEVRLPTVGIRRADHTKLLYTHKVGITSPVTAVVQSV